MPVPSIFISYRRDDSAGHAGRLFDHLVERFGTEHVFMDVAGIAPGRDFIEAIETAVGGCDVLLAVIGKQWFTLAGAESMIPGTLSGWKSLPHCAVMCGSFPCWCNPLSCSPRSRYRLICKR